MLVSVRTFSTVDLVEKEKKLTDSIKSYFNPQLVNPHLRFHALVNVHRRGFFFLFFFFSFAILDLFSSFSASLCHCLR